MSRREGQYNFPHNRRPSKQTLDLCNLIYKNRLCPSHQRRMILPPLLTHFSLRMKSLSVLQTHGLRASQTLQSTKLKQSQIQRLQTHCVLLNASRSWLQALRLCGGGVLSRVFSVVLSSSSSPSQHQILAPCLGSMISNQLNLKMLSKSKHQQQTGASMQLMRLARQTQQLHNTVTKVSCLGKDRTLTTLAIQAGC